MVCANWWLESKVSVGGSSTGRDVEGVEVKSSSWCPVPFILTKMLPPSD